jgi:hypothetical protein
MRYALALLSVLCCAPAWADITPATLSGWTVIPVHDDIKPADFVTFQRLTENANPDTTLVIVGSPGGDLEAAIGMGKLIRQKRLLVGAIGICGSSCALMWIGGETGRKFIYQQTGTGLCFHQAS